MRNHECFQRGAAPRSGPGCARRSMGRSTGELNARWAGVLEPDLLRRKAQIELACFPTPGVSQYGADARLQAVISAFGTDYLKHDPRLKSPAAIGPAIFS